MPYFSEVGINANREKIAGWFSNYCNVGIKLSFRSTNEKILLIAEAKSIGL